MEPVNILSLNPGSSSMKAALFSHRESGWVRLQSFSETFEGADPFAEKVKDILNRVSQSGKIFGVGCRAVDGGPEMRQSVRVDETVIARLQSRAREDPLHGRASVEAIQLAQQYFPEVPIVVVFDTGFHQTIPDHNALYAIDAEVSDRWKIRRLGFHGLVYQSVVSILNEHRCLPKRLVAAHLGSGSSASAIQLGLSVDTTMGFTPLEGLVMGTRSGTIDPGMILFLLDQGYDRNSLNQLLNRESGLLGVSGETSDVRVLESNAAQGNLKAEFALDLFARSAAKHIAALAVSMGGLDGLCFSGGIGEGSAPMRSRICRYLEFLDFKLDTSRNSNPEDAALSQISQPATCPIWIVKADEQKEIAAQTLSVLTKS